MLKILFVCTLFLLCIIIIIIIIIIQPPSLQIQNTFCSATTSIMFIIFTATCFDPAVYSSEFLSLNVSIANELHTNVGPCL
jgi:hypothetical protein